jgi:CRISPR-associated endoribonuclease Cas6
MRLKIEISSDNVISLPRNYNHVLQGWLYNQISDPAYRAYLHNQGYVYNKRRFKLFTFSRLHGQWSLDYSKKYMVFQSPVHLQVASPLLHLMKDVAITLLMGEPTILGGNSVTVSALHASGKERLPGGVNKWRVRALSPIVAYSTILDGGK